MVIREGDVIRAEVVDVKDNGVHLRYGGIDGFVNVVNLTWNEAGPIEPSQYARKGDFIDVRVYGMTPERFYASVKDLHPEANPWHEPSRYARGTRHRGTVHKVASYGAFVALDGGVVGLLPHGASVDGLSPGDVVEVVIAAVDAEKHKIEFEPVP